MISATQEIITDRGIDGFTVDEVARRSGVAKTTIYRHFCSGDELLLRGCDEMVEQFDAPDTGSLRGDLLAIIESVHRVTADPALRQVFVSMLNRAMTDEAFATHYRAMKEQRHAPLRDALLRGVERGEVDPEVDLDLAMHMAQGSFMAKRIVDNEEITVSEIEQLVDLVARALAPPAS